MSCDADISYFFFFNDTATTEIYTLSLHDALPISFQAAIAARNQGDAAFERFHMALLRARHEQNLDHWKRNTLRSEEHTSELQSRQYLVCRLLLEKKKSTHNCFIYASGY